ncbi:hypothetical protein C8C93_1997 [Acidovorax sp. 93]|uniref:hypothetical protein n=1 Tax=Acidovorax sp. 93 TaxID=2135632 RepID=UPI000F27645B|nr:hypothetical protein [Acidovorax sp. 93]RKR26749.1 hypothetical protein C8C93_1997 [Acidovorax sp. 93]
MGILDIFNKEKRTLALEKIEYEECHKDRRRVIDSFRKNAFDEFAFKYPDASPLMDRFNPNFMLFHKESRILRVGQFADYYAPFLHHVGTDDDSLERRAVIADYKRQISNREGVIGPDSVKKFKELTKYSSKEWAKSFCERGFVLTGALDKEYGWIYGGALFLDGVQIAKASVCNPKPANYFSEKLFENIIKNKKSTPTGFSSLVLTMGRGHVCYSPSKYHHEIIFDNTIIRDKSKIQPVYNDPIILLRNFLCAIEGEFSNPNSFNINKMDFVTQQWEELFDSHEMPEKDDSIESEYPF